MKESSYSEQNTDEFCELISEEIINLIIKKSESKVRHRVSKALDHYTKGRKLSGIDDEMGVIRCIAAEEELVVAIFEHLKLHIEKLPEERFFVQKQKSHPAKLAFHPVLLQFRWILEEQFRHGITIDGLEDVVHWQALPVIEENRVRIRIKDSNGDNLISINPLNIAISHSESGGHQEVVSVLFQDFEGIIKNQWDMNVRQFVKARADFRNKLLYAEDGGVHAMDVTLDELIDDVFKPAYTDLLITLAILLGNEPTRREWGIIAQFVGLYRQVLNCAKLE